MPGNQLFKRFLKSLICKLFIIGHATEGESIVFLLCDGETVVYSCVVDSFTCEKEVVSEVILKKLNISHITDLFWTHPHDDHSAGITTLIEQYTPENIYIPDCLIKLPDDTQSISRDVLNEINKLNGYDRRCKNRQKVRVLGTGSLVHRGMLSVGAKKVYFEMITLAPSAGRLRSKVVKQTDQSGLNDLSIVLSIVIGDCVILLTGDIQNGMIAWVRDDLVDLVDEVPVPNILKIPHHGSKYSTEIFSLFEGDAEALEACKVDIGITTSKKSSSLPRAEAMKVYGARCGELYQVDPDSSKLSIWGVDIDIIAGKINGVNTETEFGAANFVPYV